MTRRPIAIGPGLAILLGTAWPWSAAPARADRRDTWGEYAWLDPQAPQVTIAVGDGPASYHFVAIWGLDRYDAPPV